MVTYLLGSKSNTSIESLIKYSINTLFCSASLNLASRLLLRPQGSGLGLDFGLKCLASLNVSVIAGLSAYVVINQGVRTINLLGNNSAGQTPADPDHVPYTITGQG